LWYKKTANRRPTNPGAKLEASLLAPSQSESVLGISFSLVWEAEVGAQSPVPGILVPIPGMVFTYHPQPASLLHSKHLLALHAGQVPDVEVIKVVKGCVDESEERSQVSSNPALEAEYHVHFEFAMQPVQE
jgi:hypothetical protein